jgi:hypothetical protein
LAKYSPNYFITKLAKNQPLFKHFSNKNNLAGIWPIPATGQIPASGTALEITTADCRIRLLIVVYDC